MSLQDPPYKIVLERSATFQHYYLIHVYPPAPLTVTYKLRDLGQALGFNVGWSAEKGVYIETK